MIYVSGKQGRTGVYMRNLQRSAQLQTTCYEEA